MKRPIILAGAPFDWAEGARAGAASVDSDGNVNWMAAMCADPGVMRCPACGEYLWAEGLTVRCPDCGHEWRTRHGLYIDERKKPPPARGSGCLCQWEQGDSPCPVHDAEGEAALDGAET